MTPQEAIEIIRNCLGNLIPTYSDEMDAFGLAIEALQKQTKEENMGDFKVVLPTTTEEWQRDMNIVYNKAINEYVVDAITEFQKFDKEHGYPTLGDISDILSDVAEKMKQTF